MFRAHGREVWGVAISPDGKTLASGGSGGLLLFDIASGKYTVTTLQGGGGSVLAYGPDGRALAAAGGDGPGALWDEATGKLTKILRGHSDRVYSFSFSPDGKTLASGTIKLWDMATRKNTATIKAHSEGIYCVAFSRDGKTLASVSQGEIRLWEVPAAKHDSK